MYINVTEVYSGVLLFCACHPSMCSMSFNGDHSNIYDRGKPRKQSNTAVMLLLIIIIPFAI